MVAVPDWLPAEQVVVAAAFAVAVVIVRRLDADPGRIGRALRRRLLFGLPVGTLTVVAGVLAVYLFVQGGVANWHRPVVVPFRAWSYLAPLGVLTAGFTHTGPGHLTGNLIATLAFGSLAEYAYGHFPRERGASSFAPGEPLANPFVRALVVVPGVTVVAGLFTAAFSVGPVIGFSGVVFAYAGFALVSYPLGTVVASAATGVGSLLYGTAVDPQPVVESRPVFRTPWFAEIAIQTHALGFLAGVLVGLAVLRRRGGAGATTVDAGSRTGRDRGTDGDGAGAPVADGSGPGGTLDRVDDADDADGADDGIGPVDGRRVPSATALAVGVLVFVVARNLWAVYWFRGGGRFVLFRWVGAALVAALTVLIVWAATGSDRPIVPRLAVPDPGTVREAVWSATPRTVAVLVVLVATVGLAGPAIPVNLGTPADGPLPGDPLTVRDYQVTYAEDVPDGMVGVVEFEAFGESTAVNTSGVIVRSRERGLWSTEVRTGELDLNGRTRVVVGGVGWRETVVADRDGWDVVGNATAYRVNLTHAGETTTAYVSPARRASPVVAGRNVSIVPSARSFAVRVERAGRVETAPLPAANESVTVDGVRFSRREGSVVAVRNGTRVEVASRERYRGRQ